MNDGHFGTPAYMPPEMMGNPNDVSQGNISVTRSTQSAQTEFNAYACDVFSFAVIAWVMWTKRFVLVPVFCVLFSCFRLLGLLIIMR